MAELLWAAGGQLHRTTLDPRRAHDEAGRLFMAGQAQGVVVLDDAGHEEARYELPDVKFPAEWPVGLAKAKRPRPAPKADESPMLEPSLTEEALPSFAPMPALTPQSTLPLCGCCGEVLGPAREGDDDPTPAGRSNAYRCPECGFPMPGKTRLQIERKYLSSLRQDVRIITPQSPPTRMPAMPPTDTGFWRLPK